jgi:hypothetical protein
MGLTMRERHAMIRELAPRFRKATKKQRGQILSEFVELTTRPSTLRPFERLTVTFGGGRPLTTPATPHLSKSVVSKVRIRHR